jgi:hypothetical protein
MIPKLKEDFPKHASQYESKNLMFRLCMILAMFNFGLHIHAARSQSDLSNLSDIVGKAKRKGSALEQFGEKSFFRCIVEENGTLAEITQSIHFLIHLIVWRPICCNLVISSPSA